MAEVEAEVEGGRQLLPIRTWIRGYGRASFGSDLVAGLVIAALAVPQALGYAGLARVPVQVGLYAIPLALIAYAVLGTSRQLVVGPVSTVSVLSGSLVLGMGAEVGSSRAVALTAALAIAAGVVLMAAGLLRLGWSAEFLSKPIVTGFVFGLVIVIVIGEVPKMLGLTTQANAAYLRTWEILSLLGELDPTTALVAAASLALLFAGSRFAPRVPWGLVVLLSAIALSRWLDLSGEGVAVVGTVPRGLPDAGLPGIATSDLLPVATGGLALALVALAEGLSAARLYATKGGYRIDTDQELVAAGAANLASGVIGGMGVGGSLSKTAASDRAGGRTQAAGLVTAAVVLVVAVVLAPQLAPLPIAVLAAIVVQAVWGLMDVQSMRRYAQIRRNDFVSAVMALVGVVAFGPLYGLLLAIVQSVLGLVYRSSRVHLEVMGKVAGEKAAWGGLSRHPERETVDQILVLRLDNPLFWVNSTLVHDKVIAAVRQYPQTRIVVLDLEATSQLDTTSVDTLVSLLRTLREWGMDLYLVRVLRRSRTVLDRSGFLSELGEGRVWHSISQAVREAKAANKAARKAEKAAAEHEEQEPEPEEVEEEAGEHIAVDHEPLDGEDEPPVGWLRWLQRWTGRSAGS